MATGTLNADLPEVRAVRTATQPLIDGDLNEVAWQSAPVCAAFRQREPIEGGEPSERTEVRVLFDADKLYFAVRCFDVEPHRITATQLRRDSDIGDDDNVFVILDTYNNRRGGFLFNTNPLGARRDAILMDEGRSRNEAWDAIWESVGRIDAEGWTAEIAIPFDQLRFESTDEAIWGINIGRVIARRSEENYLAVPPQAFGFSGGMRTSILATLHGLGALREQRLLQVTPYVLPGVRRDFEDRNLEKFFDIGGDLKYGISRSVTLDLSYNTDFAQVESDQEAVNLTRFSLFFPEKRHFFLEGAGIFAFGERRQRFGGRPPTLLFYSRRIGIQDGHGIPVTYGAKVTGRVGAFEIGALNMMTESGLFRDKVEEDFFFSADGHRFDKDEIGELSSVQRAALAIVDTVTQNVIDTLDVERTLFTVLRVKRDLPGQSQVGLLLADRSPGQEEDYNRTVGVDASLSFDEGATSLRGFVGRTWTPGLRGPNAASFVEFDHRVGTTEFNASFIDIGEDFNPEIGFVPRDDVRRLKGQMRWRPRPQTEWIRRYATGPEWSFTMNRDNELESRSTKGFFFINTEAGDWMGIEVEERFERLDESFEIDDGIEIPVGDHTFRQVSGRLFLNDSRRLGGSAGASAGEFFNGTRRRLSIEGVWKANARWNTETKYEINLVELPASKFTAYRLSQRMLISLNTDLYLRGLAQWNSKDEIVGVNVLFSYRYRPGSDLFLVYNHAWDTEGGRRQRNRSLQLKLAYFGDLHKGLWAR
ncbi:MAG: DUF5916 domain-containing protein [Candidatus Latescibacterota bacterium]|nr:DUF5916 domain-containing protein [Candidatus Latescibacterota bacterium]